MIESLYLVKTLLAGSHERIGNVLFHLTIIFLIIHMFYLDFIFKINAFEY